MAEHVTLTCTNTSCARTFTRLRSQIVEGDPFCSRECQNAYRTVDRGERTCENERCQASFTPPRATRDRARFCSRDCMLDAARIDMDCPSCGTTHRVRKADTRSKRSRAHFCDACRDLAPDQRGRPEVTKVEVTCSNPDCGATMLRYRRQVEQATSGRLFCGKACRTAAGARVSAKPERQCQRDACGRMFRPGKNAGGKFCSRECAAEHKASARVARECAGCGTTFQARASDPDVYHSWQCYQDHRGTPVGARKRHQDGYTLIYAPGHPEAQATGWAFEHRVRVSDLLARALRPGEEVHHIDTQRANNTVDGPLRLQNGRLRSGNLELWRHSQPSGGHVGDQMAAAMELLFEMGYSVTEPR